MKKKIEVLTTHGTRLIDSTVFEQFAVHRSVVTAGLSTRQWTVTHIPSGYSLGREYTKKQAYAVAQKLSRMQGQAFWYVDGYGWRLNPHYVKMVYGIINRAQSSVRLRAKMKSATFGVIKPYKKGSAE